MLVQLGSAAVRRMIPVMALLFGLITLHYVYFNQLPEGYAAIISLTPKPTNAATPDTFQEVNAPTSPDTTAPSLNPPQLFSGTMTLPSIPSPTPSTTSRPAATSWTINPLPQKHWQSWKVTPLKFEDEERELVLTWREKNPTWRYELLSDDVTEAFVNETFPLNLDIVSTFHNIKDIISRADMLRYLILYANGGVYSDIDTKALKPISQWVPKAHAGKVNVVIGIEIDEPDVMWLDWADNFAFCQSTLLSSPKHRIFEIITQDIIRKFNEAAVAQKTDIGGVSLSFQDVLRTTGPIAFTDAVFQYLSEETGTNVGRTNFSGIHIPKQMADVLVLPTVGFVPGQPHSQSGKPEDMGAMVQHMGKGSWRGAHVFDTDENKNKEENKDEAGREAGKKEERKKGRRGNAR